MRTPFKVLALAAVLIVTMLLVAAAVGATGVICAATKGCLMDPVPANCTPARAEEAVPFWVSEEKVIDGVPYWCAQL